MDGCQCAIMVRYKNWTKMSKRIAKVQRKPLKDLLKVPYMTMYPDTCSMILVETSSKEKSHPRMTCSQLIVLAEDCSSILLTAYSIFLLTALCLLSGDVGQFEDSLPNYRRWLRSEEITPNW